MPIDGRGPDHIRWQGNDVGYSAVHKRLVAARGPAKEHVCVDCPEQAKHWSYREGGGGQPFSTNLDDYEPRCAPCHKKLDHVDRSCSIPGCDREHHAKELCSIHYFQQPDRRAASRDIKRRKRAGL